MLVLKRYNRQKAVEYAREFALKKNLKYYDYSKIGGNCTNYISQCLFAGARVMNFKQNGWFYRSSFDYSSSWTGVEFLYDFLINNKQESIFAENSTILRMEIGDIIQLRFKNKKDFGHSLIVTKIENYTPNGIYVCANSKDVLDFKLTGFAYQDIRYIHILGVRENI